MSQIFHHSQNGLTIWNHQLRSCACSLLSQPAFHLYQGELGVAQLCRLLTSHAPCLRQALSSGQEGAHRAGEILRPRALAADRTRATPPHALGEAMEVPFMNCRLSCVHCGTGAIAPPGALRVTPTSPSGVGPLEDQLYCRPCTWHS